MNEHGTLERYRAHLLARTVPCPACCRANARAKKRYRLRGKCARGLGWPILPGR